MRLIDADALRESIISRRPEISYEDAWALTCIDHAPTADARENVHGVWIDIKHTFMTKCSLCDWINNDDSSYNFCPCCGADMRGDS